MPENVSRETVDEYSSMSWEDRIRLVNAAVLVASRDVLPFAGQPVACVQWVHIDQVQANDWNPNSVAGQEMKLLHTSISEDGYTQPTVTVIEPRMGIIAPCGHLSSMDLSLAGPLMRVFWGTVQGSLTGREVSLPLPDFPTGIPDGVFKSASLRGTTGETSVSGSEISGAWVASTNRGDSASPTSGTSLGSEMSSTYFQHRCPTCALSKHAHSMSWKSFRLSLEGLPEVNGLTVSWISSANTEDTPVSSSLEPSIAASLPSNGNFHIVLRDVSKAIIVDGFHRYMVMKKYPDINAKTRGYLPVVVIDKPPADRMASTVRHNRARGKHSVAGMGSLVFGMLSEGQTDVEICKKLGMEAEELLRLKHITGYAKLYADATYSPLVVAETQLKEKAAYKKDHPEEEVPVW